MNVKLTKAQKAVTIQETDDIAAIMQQVLKRENKMGRAQEHFWIVGLNNANKILFIELVALGRQNRVNANPPDVFRMAIYKLAVKAILVHNHPSGRMALSAADKAITDRLIKVGDIINVRVIDHLIISETNYLSMGKVGLLDELRRLDTWRVLGEEDFEGRLAEQQVERDEIERKNTIAIAKRMKEKGVDNTTIKEYTGLKMVVIKNL